MARKTKAKPKPEPREALIDAALALAATRDWRSVTMAEIADEAGLALPRALGLYSGKDRVLAGFFERIDDAVLAGTPLRRDDGESVRDRLFDVMMQRFDALDGHKAALGNLLDHLRVRPMAAVCQGCRLLRSMRLMLETAGVDTSGLPGRVKAKGLAAVYLNAMRVWLGDDSDDQAATMATLDRGLMRAEKLAGALWPSAPRARTEDA